MFLNAQEDLNVCFHKLGWDHTIDIVINFYFSYNFLEILKININNKSVLLKVYQVLKR